MYLTTHSIDVASMVLEARRSDGALALFVGVLRNDDDGKPTTRISCGASGAMAESEMEKCVAALAREWPLVRVRFVSRVVTLEIGEASVAIVASSPHRDDAFAACRAAIDRIKTTVPIWKKEFHPDGS